MTTIVEECRVLLSSGTTMEDVLSTLRKRGLSKVQSIKVVVAVTGLGPNEAKELVHFSQAWQDARAAGELLHEEIERVLDQEDKR